MALKCRVRPTHRYIRFQGNGCVGRTLRLLATQEIRFFQKIGFLATKEIRFF
jgi:hypothetical protein